MQFALVHENSLILGPIGFNVRMINSELEDLDLSETVTTESYKQVPIHFSDGLTHLVIVEFEIPPHDSKYHNLGNFSWEIIRENDIPIKVKLTYPVLDKTLEEVKELRKRELPLIRKQKENSIIKLVINETEIEVSTTREERLILSSKLSSIPDTHNYKFRNTWLEINAENLQYILNEIDKVVQEAYNWEFSKLNEIDSCNSIDEVYNVLTREIPNRFL